MAGGTGEAGRMMLQQFHKLAKGRGLVGRAAQTNEPILVADTTQNPEWLPNPLLPDTKSEAAIPISVGDLVLGVLDVQHSVSGGLKREDIDALQSIANQVAVALQNTRSYTEIQRSQLLLAEALSISRLANWEYDLEQDLFTFNDQFYSIFRTSADKVGGYKLSSADYARLFVHPEDAPLVGSEIQKTLENRDRRYSAELEHRIIFSDGQIGYISVRITVERDENGNVLRWYGANQDITERRTMEEMNRKRAIEQEAINMVTQKIQSATNVEAALQIAARELGHVLGRRQTLVALNPLASADNSKGNVNK
jgi:PAS domain S-box-containing protein